MGKQRVGCRGKNALKSIEWAAVPSVKRIRKTLKLNNN